MVQETGGGSTAKNSQFVWSPVYVDALVMRDRDANLTMTDGFEERLYVVQEANWNVTALVDPSGTVLERYQYDPYGRVTFLTPTWGSRNYGGNYGFGNFVQDAAADISTRTANFRNRTYNWEMMRWMQQDPAGYVDGGNLYQFNGSGPTNYVDPLGL